MDFKSVQEILRFVNKSDLTEVELEDGEFKLKIKRAIPGAGAVVEYVSAPQAVQVPVSMPVQVQAPVVQTAATGGENVPVQPNAAAEIPSGANLHTILSPMIGTFYKSASPDKEAFVKVGDTISPGQTLCIIEAMKLFNEIESEVSGKIVKILVENAQPVEYDQPLFVVELSK